MNTLFSGYSSSIKLPNLIKINNNIVLAFFQLMKLLPAKYVVEKGINEKKISKKDGIVETSSGTYALGLAIVCAEYKIPFHIVSDRVIDENLKQQIQLLGGEVEIVEEGIEGIQVSRLNALKKYRIKNPRAFWPNQYDNPEHLEAYSVFADYLINNIGNDFILVGSVGSGSSSCGTIKRLRTYNPSISLVGVDTFGSILFGLENKKRVLRGLGNSIMPKNLIHSFFDQVHWVSGSLAFQATRELFSNYACYAGPTTGASYQVAKWIASEYPHKKVVFIGADMGYRYGATVYNDIWVKQMDYLKEQSITPTKLARVSELNNITLEWGYLDWKRTTLEKVLNE